MPPASPPSTSRPPVASDAPDAPGKAPADARPDSRHRWLAVLPVLHAVAGVLVADRVRPFIAGLPFFMAWVISGTLLCALVMAIVYRLDPANHGDEEVREEPRP